MFLKMLRITYEKRIARNSVVIAHRKRIYIQNNTKTVGWKCWVLSLLFYYCFSLTFLIMFYFEFQKDSTFCTNATGRTSLTSNCANSKETLWKRPKGTVTRFRRRNCAGRSAAHSSTPSPSSLPSVNVSF